MQFKTRYLIASALLSATPLIAQVSTATVSGSITDTTGAVIPAATVLATEQATGIKSKGESNSAGQYDLPFLKPGTYVIQVSLPGFQVFEQTGVTVASGDHPTIDIALHPGDQHVTVEVETTTSALGTADASIGQTITTKQVEDLPLNGRAPLTFVQYSPGVIATTNPAGVHAYDNSGLAGFSVAGLPNKNSEILLDGSPDNASDNSPAYSPPINATAEVRLNVFESDAAYGHSGGGVANQVTKSGTNRYHGEAYEYNQISALNANGYFADRTTARKTVTRYNQFGGSIGGPVRLPYLFNGSDKLFFFVAYEGIRTPFPGGFFATVPTQAERTGDFSALLGTSTTASKTCVVNGVQQTYSHDTNQIFDPSTLIQAPNCPTGFMIRAPFAGNRITSAINPVAAGVFNYLPLPNVAGGAQGTNNYYGVSQGSDHYDNHFGRLDYSLGTRNRLYLTARQNERDQIVSQTFGPGDPAFGDLLQRVNWGGSVGDIISISPSLIGEVRLNYTRFLQNSLQNGDGFAFSSLGFPASLQAQSRRTAFPMFVFSSGNFPNPGSTTMTPGTAPFNSYGIYADAIKSLGAHTLKIGTDLRLFQKGQGQFASTTTSEAGRYTLDNTFTRAVPTISEATVIGQDIAALYLGLNGAGTFDQYAASTGNQHYMSFFVQDDWRVTPRLTLNAGLRFDRDFSPYERNGKAVNGFAAGTANPISAAAIAAYTASPNALLPAAQFTVNGGLTFASPTNRAFEQSNSNMFSPRFGFAYRPEGLGQETVIRGGFGVFVLPIFPFNNSINQQGFSQQTVQTISNDNNLTAATSLSNPFPNGLVAPTGSSAGLSTFLGNTLTYASPVVKNGYAERYTLDIQRQLPGKVLAEVAYIGNVAHRLPINQFPNYVKPQFETTASNASLGTSTANPFKGLLPNSGTLNGSTVRVAQLLSVFPEFPLDGITVQNAPAGSSNFNALEVRAERRTQKGLTLIANYQFSKLMEAVTYLNNSDPRPEYRISQYDRPHHLVVGVTYDLPFGRGRTFGSHSNRLVDALLGGFTINSLYLLQSGAPLAFGNIVPFNVKSLNYNPREATEVTSGTTRPAFDLTQFDRVSADQPQFNIRTLPTQFSTLRTDKLMNWDASILKNIHFTEGTYFQFRFEGYNIANRPSFSGPNLSPTSSTFGQISGTQNGARTIQMAGRIVF